MTKTEFPMFWQIENLVGKAVVDSGCADVDPAGLATLMKGRGHSLTSCQAMSMAWGGPAGAVAGLKPMVNNDAQWTSLPVFEFSVAAIHCAATFELCPCADYPL